MRPGRIQSGTGTVRLGCGGHATCWLGHPVGVTTILDADVGSGDRRELFGRRVQHAECVVAGVPADLGAEHRGYGRAGHPRGVREVAGLSVTRPQDVAVMVTAA